MSFIHSHRPGLSLSDEAYHKMCKSRSTFLEDWKDWIATKPNTSDVADELKGTESILHQRVAIGGRNA